MEVVPWRPACWRAVWYLLPSLLPARPRPTGPPCQRSGPGRPGLATGAGVSGDRRASLPTSARRVVCPPQPERASFRAVTLWQVGHLASGPPSPESPTALGTPPPQRPKWATALTAGPAQRDTASLPQPGHRLYLPQQGRALAPRPSTICPLRLLRGQPDPGHPHPQALGSHAGDRPAGCCSLGKVGCCLMLPPRPSNSRTQVPTIPGSLFSRRIQGESETHPSVS